MSISANFSNIKSKLSKFFFRKDKNYINSLIIGTTVAILVIFLFITHSFTEIEKGLQALIYQIGYKLPEDSSLVTVIKKDQTSSNLLKTDINKREIHASMFNLMGSRQIKDRMIYKSRSQTFELLNLKLGFFQDIHDQYPITTSFEEWKGMVDNNPEKNEKNIKFFNQENWLSSSRLVRDFFKDSKNKDKPGFTSFIKFTGNTWKPRGQNIFKVLAGGNNYLIFPTLCIDWNSDETRAEVRQIFEEDFDEEDFKKRISSAIDLKSQDKSQSIEELVRRWSYFYENLLYADIVYNVKLFPKSKNKNENTFFSLSIKIKTQGRDTSYTIEPAAVIGFDFVLQGDKEPIGDALLEKSLMNCKSKVILAARRSIEKMEDEGARDESSFSQLQKQKVFTNSQQVENQGSKSSLNQKIKTSSIVEDIFIKPADRFLKNKKSVDYAMIDMGSDHKSYVYQVPLILRVKEDVYKNGVLIATETLKPSFALRIALEKLDFDNAHLIPEKLEKAKTKLSNTIDDLKKKEIENEITEMEKILANSKPGYVETQKEVFDKIREDFCKGNFKGDLIIKDLNIPINSEGYLYLNFSGSTRKGSQTKAAIDSVSYYECLEDNLLKEYLKKNPENTKLEPAYAHRRTAGGKNTNKGNKVYIAGTFEAVDFDVYASPLSYPSPYKIMAGGDLLMGIEIHANAIMNILNRKFLKHPNYNVCVVCIFVVSLFAALVLETVTPLAGAFLSLLIAFAIMSYSYFSYHILLQVFHCTPLLTSVFIIWVVNTLVNYLKQRIKANTTKDMFSRFVSADVVQYMLDNPELVRPGGTKTELTIFFSDVAGFTTISEGLSPEDLVILLNEYLGAMTDLLFEYGGTLDKFIGDAVMAFWNFPKKQEDHAVKAVLCAIAMQKKIKELQVDWARRGFPKVAARCGINTQDVVVGYMGSQKAQMNFTCMGDGVNLASRLEGANKEYGTMMMVSDNTYQRVKHAVRGRFLDFLAVKGKKEPVKVHELVCKIGDEPEGWFERTELYDKAIQLHLERKWDEAIATFEEVLKLDPNDGPSKTYITRCNEYKVNPPPEGWDGRYILTHK